MLLAGQLQASWNGWIGAQLFILCCLRLKERQVIQVLLKRTMPAWVGTHGALAGRLQVSTLLYQDVATSLAGSWVVWQLEA
jgi:hypothetical protein